MMEILLQATSRPDPRVVLREHFSKQAWDPESWIGFIVVAACITIVVLILHFLLYYEKRSDKSRQVSSPQRLFREILKRLELNVAQRALLVRMARDLRRRSPTQMLLSPKFFDQAVARWLSKGSIGLDSRAQELRVIGEKLFPTSDTG